VSERVNEWVEIWQDWSRRPTTCEKCMYLAFPVTWRSCMRMSAVAFRRGMTFVTFLTCCAALALLLAALTTQHWIAARAHRTSTSTNTKSDGRIHIGLFYGRKNLNAGIGWRSSDINGEFLCKCSAHACS